MRVWLALAVGGAGIVAVARAWPARPLPGPIREVLAAGARRGTPFEDVEAVAQDGPYTELRACRGAGAQGGCEVWLRGPELVAPGDRAGFLRAVRAIGLSALGGDGLARLFLGLHPDDGVEATPDSPRTAVCPSPESVGRLSPRAGGASERIVERSPPSSYALVYDLELEASGELRVRRWPCKSAPPDR